MRLSGRAELQRREFRAGNFRWIELTMDRAYDGESGGDVAGGSKLSIAMTNKIVGYLRRALSS